MTDAPDIVASPEVEEPALSEARAREVAFEAMSITHPAVQADLVAYLHGDDKRASHYMGQRFVVAYRAAKLAFARAAAQPQVGEVEDRLQKQIDRLQGAISWIDKPFTDGITHEELKQRVQFVLDDAALCAAPFSVGEGA